RPAGIWSSVLSAARRSFRHAFAEDHPYKQNLRRNEERILDLCPGAIPPGYSCRAHGISRRRLVHRSQWQYSRPKCDRQLDRPEKIPVMICVFINPGDISESPGTPTFNFVKAHSEKWHRSLKDSMRSALYDTVSDRYARFLRDEVIPEVTAK